MSLANAAKMGINVPPSAAAVDEVDAVAAAAAPIDSGIAAAAPECLEPLPLPTVVAEASTAKPPASPTELADGALDDAVSYAQLPYSAVSLCALSAGEEHSCAVTATGVLYAWGTLPAPPAAGTPRNAPLRGRRHYQPRQARCPSPIAAVASGAHHALALSRRGRVYALGGGRALGVTPAARRGWSGGGTPVSPMMGAVTAVAVGFVPTLVKALQTLAVTKVSCGHSHSAAIAGEAIYTWGCGHDGQLGHGDYADRPAPVAVRPRFAYRANPAAPGPVEYQVQVPGGVRRPEPGSTQGRAFCRR